MQQPISFFGDRSPNPEPVRDQLPEHSGGCVPNALSLNDLNSRQRRLRVSQELHGEMKPSIPKLTRGFEMLLEWIGSR